MENFIEMVKVASKVHPARELDFTDLTQGLFAEVEKGNVNVGYHPEFPHLAIFKYSQNCVVERVWNEFSIMARGLILDLQNKKVIATPFVKFWNYNEMFEAVEVIEAEYEVLNKYDGSMGIMFFFEDEWRVATAGSFMSEQAIWATKWIHENIPLEKVDKLNTYLFEIIYPENKIVINYDFSGLVLLTIIDSYGLEYNYFQLVLEAQYLHTKCAKKYDFNDMNSIVETAKKLDQNHEGYVIRFKSGVRLKVKGDEYVRIHRLISRVTPLAIWDLMLHGENVEELVKDLPEEMEKDFEIIFSIIENKLKTFVEEVERMHEETNHMSDKELGLFLLEDKRIFKNRIFKNSPKYIFLMRKGSFYEGLRDFSSPSRKKIFNVFRPKANVLEGYVPSSIVNRFSDNI